jgi:amino acid transporter
VACSRLLFAFGRRQTIPRFFGSVHTRFQTPATAIIGVTAATLVGLLLGDALLVPVTEVGSMASAFGWLSACLSFYIVEKASIPRMIAALGIAVSLLLLLMKWLPGIPGHFSLAEWIALSTWLVLGLILHRGWRAA